MRRGLSDRGDNDRIHGTARLPAYPLITAAIVTLQFALLPTQPSLLVARERDQRQTEPVQLCHHHIAEFACTADNTVEMLAENATKKKMQNFSMIGDAFAW